VSERFGQPSSPGGPAAAAIVDGECLVELRAHRAMQLDRPPRLRESIVIPSHLAKVEMVHIGDVCLGRPAPGALKSHPQLLLVPPDVGRVRLSSGTDVGIVQRAGNTSGFLDQVQPALALGFRAAPARELEKLDDGVHEQVMAFRNVRQSRQ
jgi:hypothetical protein